MSFQKKFFINASKVAVFKYSGSVISFLSSVIVSRLLSPAEYGLVALITVFSSFLVIFLDAGVSVAVVRSEKDLSYYYGLHFFVLLISLSLGMLMIFVSPLVANFYDNDLLLYPAMFYGLVIFVSGLPIVPMAVLSKDLDFGRVAKVGLYSTILNIALTILFAVLGFSYWSLILPQLFLPVFQYYFYSRYIDFKFKLISVSYFKEVFIKVKTLAGSMSSFTLFNYWARNADNLLVGKYYGEAALGYYNRAYTLLALPLQMLSGVFVGVLLPSYQKLVESGQEIKNEYIKTLKILSILITPISLLLILFPYRLSTFLWGKDWAEVGLYLPIFGALLILQVLSTTTGAVFVLHKAEKTLAKVGVVNAIVIILSIYVGAQFSPRYIALFYAYSFAWVTVPIVWFIGFRSPFNFSWSEIASVWAENWLFCTLILILATFDDEPITIVNIKVLAICISFVAIKAYHAHRILVSNFHIIKRMLKPGEDRAV